METTNTDALDRLDMERLAAGHDAALNDLMARHGQRVFAFLFRMLGNEDDANDLAQETFVRVFQHRGSFKADAKFLSWVYTIAGNLARNHYRWSARHPNVSLDAKDDSSDQSLIDVLPSTNADPTEAAIVAERAGAVRRAIQDLPLDLKEAIILCEWEDLSVAEAAAVLQATPKAVESRLYRARGLLRKALSQWLSK